MIPRESRVPRSVFSKAPQKKISSSHFAVKVFENNLGRNRFAAVIGSKVEKLSTRRNFWKRFILNVAAAQPNFSKDVIIFGKRGLVSLSARSAKEELEEIFKKAAEETK